MNRTGIKFKGMSNFKTTLPLGNESYRPKGTEIIILLPLQGGGQEGEVRRGMGFWANATDD
jgi:hypothetical protein